MLVIWITKLQIVFFVVCHVSFFARHVKQYYVIWVCRVPNAITIIVVDLLLRTSQPTANWTMTNSVWS